MNGRYQSILVVCTGNICRSPVGERLLRSRLPDMKVDSAGIAALTGEAADPVMAETAREKPLPALQWNPGERHFYSATGSSKWRSLILIVGDEIFQVLFFNNFFPLLKNGSGFSSRLNNQG